MYNPKQLARTGIFYLEEAILDVLFEAKHSKESDFVRLRDIRERLGTYSKWTNDNWLVRSVLYKLKGEDKVEQLKKQGPWQLTDMEYHKRL